MKSILTIRARAAWLLILWWGLLGGVLWGSGPAWAQAPIPLLHGTLTDPSGAAVPNATIHLVNTASNAERTAVTDPRGAYAFSDVAPGAYRLLVTVQGFEPYEQDGVQLSANMPVTVDVKLKVQGVQQSVTVRAQSANECLPAQARVLADVGPGLRAIRQGPSGNYYVLTAPGAAVRIYSPDGKRIGQVPAAAALSAAPDSAILNGSDLAVDSSGRVYVSDLAANAVKIYSAEGALVSKIHVLAPTSVEPLPDGEVAIASLSSTHLVDVYDEARGEVYRSFGDAHAPTPESCDPVTLICTVHKEDLQPAVNHSWFIGDSAGNLFVNLADAKAPTIRKYDAGGYVAYESMVPLDHSITAANASGWHANAQVGLPGVPTTIGLNPNTNTSAYCPPDSQGNATLCNNQPGSGGPYGGTGGGIGGGMGGGMPGGPGGGMGGGMRGGAEGGDEGRGGGGGRGGMGGGLGMIQFGLRITQDPGGHTESNPVITAIGADPQTSDVWAAIGGNLAHFDQDGTLDAYYCLFTASQSPVKITTILVEGNRLLLGTDPFGIFQYPRPDKPAPDDTKPH